jgi:hypothetical protein
MSSTFSRIKALVTGNPHEVASDARESYPDYYGSVDSYVRNDAGEVIGGVLDIASEEHPTVAQQQWMDDHPRVVDHQIILTDSWGRKIG